MPGPGGKDHCITRPLLFYTVSSYKDYFVENGGRVGVGLRTEKPWLPSVSSPTGGKLEFSSILVPFAVQPWTKLLFLVFSFPRYLNELFGIIK